MGVYYSYIYIYVYVNFLFATATRIVYYGGGTVCSLVVLRFTTNVRAGKCELALYVCICKYVLATR